MEMQPCYTMQAAARLSGVSPHVIRIWERRYEAVTPARSDTGRRLYSQGDVERLALLKRAREHGHSIGQIARLPVIELARLARTDEVLDAAASADGEVAGGSEQGDEGVLEAEGREFLEQCYAAASALDAQALEAVLERALVALGRIALLQNVVAPLMHRIGDNWREGAMRVAQEHMAAATIRKFLDGLTSSQHQATAPLLVVTTPAGQVHELGALMAAAAADAAGWRVLYLGASLPAEEIAAATLGRSARAVALSVVYPLDDPRLLDELALLRRHLPAQMPVLVGGGGATLLRTRLLELKLTPVGDIPEFRALLEALRRPADADK